MEVFFFSPLLNELLLTFWICLCRFSSSPCSAASDEGRTQGRQAGRGWIAARASHLPVDKLYFSFSTWHLRQAARMEAASGKLYLTRFMPRTVRGVRAWIFGRQSPLQRRAGAAHRMQESRSARFSTIISTLINSGFMDCKHHQPSLPPPPPQLQLVRHKLQQQSLIFAFYFRPKLLNLEPNILTSHSTGW